MIYKEKISNRKAKITSSEFSTSCNNVTETMVMFEIIDKELSFKEQLSCIIEEFHKWKENNKSFNDVFKRFFISDSSNQENLIKEIIANKNEIGAVSIVEQPPLNGTKVALWVYFQSNLNACISENGLAAYSHGKYYHYWTGTDVAEEGDSCSQTIRLFNNYIDKAKKVDCSLKANCIRTWLLVQNIDINYKGIVLGRNIVFDENDLTKETHFIASTGIQGRTANENELVQMNTYSVKGLKDEQIQFLKAFSNLNSTYEYGVRFERGTAISYGDRKHVFISGTASINNKGEVIYVGDIKRQTLRMLDNVRALLQEADCLFSDIAIMIIYLRDMADYDIVRKIFNEHFNNVPSIFVLAPVCRPTWLIEMECIALKENTDEKFENF